MLGELYKIWWIESQRKWPSNCRSLKWVWTSPKRMKNTAERIIIFKQYVTLLIRSNLYNMYNILIFASIACVRRDNSRVDSSFHWTKRKSQQRCQILKWEEAMESKGDKRKWNRSLYQLYLLYFSRLDSPFWGGAWGSKNMPKCPKQSPSLILATYRWEVEPTSSITRTKCFMN